MVDSLLALERRRIGVQPFIDLQVRLAVGHVQHLIEYYRRGMVTTIDHDDTQPDGFASKVKLPPGAMIRSVFHVRTGSRVISRPMYQVDWSNARDLRAGVVDSRTQFRYSINPRDGGRDMLAYPILMEGYSIRIEWDAIIGRSSEIQYQDSDEVPFDEPMAQIVYHYVKSRLASEVDNNLAMKREHELDMRVGVNRLYAEVQERQRRKIAESEASNLQPCRSEGLVTNIPGAACGTIDPETLTLCKPVEPAGVEWVMFGDSGEYATINDTAAVASVVNAVNPDFVFHMGDAAYGFNGKPDGSPVILNDMFLKFYWNMVSTGRMWFTPGNHDLITGYGDPIHALLPNVKEKIGTTRFAARKLWYDFAVGNVRFFVVNSGINDSDSNIFISEARAWLAERTCASKEQWFVLTHHRPQYTSDSSHAPGSALMRQLTPHLFGIDLVVSAHAHNYERILDQHGLMHVICGLGGATKRGPGASVADGHQFFYNSKNGFLRFFADADTMQFELVNVDGAVVDRMTLQKPVEPRECLYAYAP